MSDTFTGARAPAGQLIPNVYPSVLPPADQHRAHGPHLNASVVVVVVILSAVLILSGLLHLLARCLGRRRQRRRAVPVREHSPLVSALHGQLQHLFHLHDAGVEQAFIETLPVFAYGSIRGLKDSTDCAVCLTEFGDDDRLRLLPKCKHAFHLECIDTWLLSNSTCPLCRRSLLPDPHLHGGSSSHHHHSEPLLGDDAPGVSSSGSPEEQLLAHPNTSRRTTIASLHGSIHGSYQNSFRICDAVPSSDHDSDQNEIQEIQEIQEIHELEEEMHREVDELLLQTPSPFAPTIRVMDVYGTQQVLKVELGRVASRAQSDSRKLTPKGARSYSMGSYEYIVDPSSWELRIAPTPYPGRPQDWAPSKPTHRSALSDSIPELASAGVTPANDELFWASRGLYNPHTLSRVRELLTPIGSEGFSPFMDSSYSPGQGDRWIDIDIERGEIMEEGCIPPQDASDIKQRSSSLSRLPAEAKASVSCFRRSLSETSAGMEQAVSALLDKGAATADCDESLKQRSKGAATSSAAVTSDETLKQGSFSRRFSLNWLMGRDKRMVFAAASPVPVPDEELQRSRPITI